MERNIVLQVRVIVGASHAYACINGNRFSLDVQLNGGQSASSSLRQSAEELRKKAEENILRAERMEAAAKILDKDSRTKYAGTVNG